MVLRAMIISYSGIEIFILDRKEYDTKPTNKKIIVAPDEYGRQDVRSRKKVRAKTNVLGEHLNCNERVCIE